MRKITCDRCGNEIDGITDPVFRLNIFQETFDMTYDNFIKINRVDLLGDFDLCTACAGKLLKMVDKGDEDNADKTM